MRKVLLASTIALLGLTGTARAHFILTSPPAVVANEPNGKGSPPCGPDKGMATTPTAAQGGHPLKISVTETVGHLGFYRVALAIKSRSELPVDNVVYDAKGNVLPPSGPMPGAPNVDSARADTQNPAVFPVLADNFLDHEKTAPNGAVYSGDVMLPNVNCDRCVLQVIEFMHPHMFNFDNNPPPGGGYFYHHCAELKITADPAMPLFVPPGADGGAPDASPTDAKTDSSPAGTAGKGGTGGTTGSAGTGGGGTTGAAGSNTAGTTGTSGAGGATGSAGTTGTAGVSGAAGMTGSAGTTGAGGSKSPHQSSGGCSYGNGGPEAPFAAAGAVLSLAAALTRRRRR